MKLFYVQVGVTIRTCDLPVEFLTSEAIASAPKDWTTVDNLF